MGSIRYIIKEKEDTEREKEELGGRNKFIARYRVLHYQAEEKIVEKALEEAEKLCDLDQNVKLKDRCRFGAQLAKNDYRGRF